MMLRKAAIAHEHGSHVTVNLSSPPIAHVTNLHELLHTACRLQGTLATHQQLQDHILKPLRTLDSRLADLLTAYVQSAPSPGSSRLQASTRKGPSISSPAYSAAQV